MSIKLSGNTSGNVAEVDSSNNVKVNTPLVDTTAGYVALLGEKDAGAIIGTRERLSFEPSNDYRMRVGVDNTLLNEYFPGAALNSALWTAPVTTMTVAVAGTLCVLNNGSSAASGAVARVSSYRSFPIYMSYPTYCEIDCQFAFVPIANNVTEWGLGIATGTASPTDGAFFRFNAAGEFRCVLNTNGTETQSSSLDFAGLIGANTMAHYIVAISDDYVDFWINDVKAATIPRTTTLGSTTMSNNLPVLLRTYNTAATGSAQQIKVGAINVSLGDQNTTKVWQDILAGAGGHCSQGQTGGTMGSTANYANSANPTAAVPTNTTAALGTGLGGQFWETDTLAANTDGIISSYQVLAGTAAIPGKSLYITHIGISSHVQTVLVGGPYVAQWSLAYGHTAVSLATTETATTKAPRRFPLPYTQAVTAAQAVNTKVGTDFMLQLNTPICVQPGEFVQLVKKKIGTAPSSGVIAHVITINGYFE